MVGVPDRVERYEPSYQQPVQPLMQSHIRPQESYGFQNAANVTPPTNTYSMPVHRRYDYAYTTQSPAVATNTPPSPPGEDINKLSLPSISSLLEISDGKIID
jgi:hypothetical protein